MKSKCCGNCKYFVKEKVINEVSIGKCTFDIGDIVFPASYQGAFGKSAPFSSIMKNTSGDNCNTFESQ